MTNHTEHRKKHGKDTFVKAMVECYTDVVMVAGHNHVIFVIKM